MKRLMFNTDRSIHNKYYMEWNLSYKIQHEDNCPMTKAHCGPSCIHIFLFWARAGL